MEKILQTGQPQIGVRLEIRQTTIIANRSPIVDDGRVLGLFSVFQDISEYEEKPVKKHWQAEGAAEPVQEKQTLGIEQDQCCGGTTTLL